MSKSMISFSEVTLAIIALIIITHSQVSFGLKCLVGLGNTSEMKKLKVVDCPEGKFYVCVKMFGGGMGDQIRRYCESIPREDYNDLLEKEDRKVSEEHFDHDPACYETVHNGRDVNVCICSGDKCNNATKFLDPSVRILCLVTVLSILSKFFS